MARKRRPQALALPLLPYYCAALSNNLAGLLELGSALAAVSAVHAGPPLGCMGWKNVELVEKSKVANKRTTTIWTPSRVVKI